MNTSGPSIRAVELVLGRMPGEGSRCSLPATGTTVARGGASIHSIYFIDCRRSEATEPDMKEVLSLWAAALARESWEGYAVPRDQQRRSGRDQSDVVDRRGGARIADARIENGSEDKPLTLPRSARVLARGGTQVSHTTLRRWVQSQIRFGGRTPRCASTRKLPWRGIVARSTID